MQVLSFNSINKLSVNSNFKSKNATFGSEITVGYAQVIDKSQGGKVVNLDVTQEPISHYSYLKDLFIDKQKFRFYNNSDLVGWMQAGDSESYRKLGYPKDHPFEYIHIDLLESAAGKLKGIGKKLVQVAIELSNKMGFKGNVILTSDNISRSKELLFNNDYGSPTGFYYEQCKFRSDHYYYDAIGEESGENLRDELIENELKKAREMGVPPNKITTINRKRLYLPQDNFLKYWLPIIEKAPIFKK